MCLRWAMQNLCFVDFLLCVCNFWWVKLHNESDNIHIPWMRSILQREAIYKHSNNRDSEITSDNSGYLMTTVFDKIFVSNEFKVHTHAANTPFPSSQICTVPTFVECLRVSILFHCRPVSRVQQHMHHSTKPYVWRKKRYLYIVTKLLAHGRTHQLLVTDQSLVSEPVLLKLKRATLFIAWLHFKT